MKRKQGRRILALLLTLCMIGACLPITAFAAETSSVEAAGTKESSTVVSTAEELYAAVANGGDIQLGDNIDLTEELNLSAETGATLDLNGYCISSANDSSISLQSGSFTIQDSSSGKTGSVTCEIMVGDDANLTITGGTFKFEPTGYIPDGYQATANQDGTWTVSIVSTVSNAVASITVHGTTTSYATTEAFRTAWDAISGEATVELLSTIDLGSASLTVADGQNITLDLNGQTLSSSATDYVVGLNPGGTLTVEDSSEGKTGAIQGTGIFAIGESTNTGTGSIQLTIHGGTVQSSSLFGMAISLGTSSTSTVTITGGTIAGGTIAGGTYASSLYLGQNATGTITGGTFQGAVAATSLTITGGSFSSAPSSSYIPAGSEITQEGGVYVVKTYVAQVGSTGKKYESLQEAFTNAGTDDTITLLKDTDLALTDGILLSNNITLDLNGKTITVAGTGQGVSLFLIAAGTFTVKDSSESQSGTIQDTRTGENYGYVFQVGEGGTLTIQSGCYANAAGILVLDAGGTATVSGGNFTNSGTGVIFGVSNAESAVATTTISGGTFTAQNDGAYIFTVNSGTTKITGGLFRGNLQYLASGMIGLNGAVSGGIFSKTVDTTCLAAGYQCAAITEGDYADMYEVKSTFAAQVLGTDGKTVVAQYATLAEALKNAASGQTVKLLNDIPTEYSSSDLSVKNITLDLNGHSLTANYVVVFDGSMIDSSEHAGSLVIASKHLAYQGTNVTYLPIYNSTNGAYKFVKIGLGAAWTKGNTTNTVWFGLTSAMTKDIYSMLKQDSSIEIGFSLTYQTTTEGTSTKKSVLNFAADSDTLSSYLENRIGGGQNYLYATFAKTDGITLESVQPYIKSGNTTTYLTRENVDYNA